MINLDKFKAKLHNIHEDDAELDKIKELFDKNDLESDYVRPQEIKTKYNTFNCYGDYSVVMMKNEDWEQFKKDMCYEFAQALPDKFDVYFNEEALLKDINESGWGLTLLGQIQEFLEQQGKDVVSIRKYSPEVYSGEYMIIELY